MNLVHGYGINDESRPSWQNGKQSPEYKSWNQIIYRCCSKKRLEKHPTYSECTVSDNFRNYSYFYDWCQKQVGFGMNGFEIDKDLLSKGNKIYSEDTCVFLPKEINMAIRGRTSKKRDLPTGVSFHKKSGKFIAYLKKSECPRVNLPS
jgi:hypothetical protein